jgi:hypothetical protein
MKDIYGLPNLRISGLRTTPARFPKIPDMGLVADFERLLGAPNT